MPQAVTIQRGKQLRLVVGFTPPTNEELIGEQDSTCKGRIAFFFPAPAGKQDKAALLKSLLASKHYKQQLTDEEFGHALLSGLLQLLHPHGDPRALLSLGLAAQQHQRMENEQQQQSLQQQRLVRNLGKMWPLCAQAAADALATAESSPFSKFNAGADFGAAAAAPAECSRYWDRMQTISLVGVCRRSFLLLLHSPEEGFIKQTPAAATAFWATYSNPTSPLVIDFNTAHVESRKCPSKLLQIRAVSPKPISWRIAPCSNPSSCGCSSSGNSNSGSNSNSTQELCAVPDRQSDGSKNQVSDLSSELLAIKFKIPNIQSLAQGVLLFVLPASQEELAAEVDGVFQLSCVEGILGNQNGREKSSEVTIRIRFR